jgi:hypothetical protein|tara:strand:+ start:123 stop:290 length:168 start_codon:yes stop_codon:yes gene_type:complete
VLYTRLCHSDWVEDGAVVGSPNSFIGLMQAVRFEGGGGSHRIAGVVRRNVKCKIA